MVATNTQEVSSWMTYQPYAELVAEVNRGRYRPVLPTSIHDYRDSEEAVAIRPSDEGPYIEVDLESGRYLEIKLIDNEWHSVLRSHAEGNPLEVDEVNLGTVNRDDVKRAAKWFVDVAEKNGAELTPTYAFQTTAEEHRHQIRELSTKAWTDAQHSLLAKAIESAWPSRADGKPVTQFKLPSDDFATYRLQSDDPGCMWVLSKMVQKETVARINLPLRMGEVPVELVAEVAVNVATNGIEQAVATGSVNHAVLSATAKGREPGLF